MSKKHILVLSVSAGAGHVRAAQALCAAAERGFRQLRLTHVDVMDLVPAGFRKLYADSYIKLVEKMPLAWAYLYQYTDQRSAKSLFDRLRRNVERLNTRKLNRELKRLAPDAIICTHFLPAELLSRRLARGRPTPPVWVQVTDFDVHGYGSIRICKATLPPTTKSLGASPRGALHRNRRSSPASPSCRSFPLHPLAPTALSRLDLIHAGLR